MIDAVSGQFGGYDWTDAGTAAAERLDYHARASELVGSGAAIRIIVGADDEQAIVSSALTIAAGIGADVQMLDGMEHASLKSPASSRRRRLRSRSGSTHSPPSGSAST